MIKGLICELWSQTPPNSRARDGEGAGSILDVMWWRVGKTLEGCLGLLGGNYWKDAVDSEGSHSAALHCGRKTLAQLYSGIPITATTDHHDNQKPPVPTTDSFP